MAVLTETENRAVAEAVAEAEKTTGGEIATAVIAESDDYGFRELVAALAAGGVAFVFISRASTTVESFLQKWLWNYELWMLPVAVGGVTILMVALFYLLLQVPALDRLILSRAVMAEAVTRRARRHFMESGVYDTVDRTGVLIFVSMLERRVELIADRGITEKVPQEAWDTVVAELTTGIAAGRIGESLVTAVREVGKILSDKVEPREKNTNELANLPVELERGS